MNGGPSQVDTFDPKPALAKYAGPAAQGGGACPRSERPAAVCCPRRSSSAKYGKSGIEVSELFPERGEVHRR